jgi:hypothetical protein
MDQECDEQMISENHPETKSSRRETHWSEGYSMRLADPSPVFAESL